MAFRSDRNRRAAAPAGPAIVPTAGLGGALAALPPPWTVFRQSSFSAFDNMSGQIYGGLYIALHPQKGIALIDLAPAQPEKAIERLRTLLRATGKPEFAADAPPIVACALPRDDLASVGARLEESFAAAPGELTGADWTDVAAAALTARLPELKRVGRAGQAPPAAEIPAAAAQVQKAAAPPPAPSRRPPPPRIDSADRPSVSVAWRPRRGLLYIVAAGIGVAAAAILLLPLAQILHSPPAAPVPSSRVSVEIAPPPAPTPAPVLAAPSPPAPAPAPIASTPSPPAPPTTAAVPPPPSPPPALAVPAPAAVAVPPTLPGPETPPPPAAVSVPAAPSQPPAQTATTMPAPPPLKPAMPPPSAAVTKARVAPAEAVRAAEPAAGKKATKPPPETATREDRARRREAARPEPPPEETVTIDGVTYVKGREPQRLGAGAPTEAAPTEAAPAEAAPAEPPPASTVAAPAPKAAPPDDEDFDAIKPAAPPPS